jgi:PAS domain S-box-containing protein
MRTLESVLPSKSNPMARVLRYLLDSVLACVGALLVTGIIGVFQLYPAISNISNVYLLVVLGLAIVRGRFAAFLSAVVAFLSLAYFIVPPLYTFAASRLEEWMALFIFLSVAMLIGHLVVTLRERTEQANHQERETRQLYEVVLVANREAEQAHQHLLAYEQAARAEAEAARARLYDLFMQAPAAMTILRGPEHRIEFVNPLVLRISGRADLVGKTAREATPELVEQGVLAILDEVYMTGTPFVGTEFPVRVDRRGDGVLEEVYYNFVYQPLRTVQGDIEGILVHSVEVTEQVLARRRVEELNRQLEAEKDALHQAEQEAQARTAELEATFEAMTEGVIVCDARGEIRYTNPAYRSLLALEEDADPSVLLLDNRFEWLALRDL